MATELRRELEPEFCRGATFVIKLCLHECYQSAVGAGRVDNDAVKIERLLAAKLIEPGAAYSHLVPIGL